jgi:serine/threonine protein phosphatase PrpC
MADRSSFNMPKISLYGKTDIGLKRADNEDAFMVNTGLGFCLVADGMGGAAAGEVASRIFAETALAVFSEAGGPSQKETIGRVQKTFASANERILDHVAKNPHHKGMGCTAELLAFSEEGMVIGHVGDSRTYCFRKGRLTQLTHDHSLVRSYIDQGIITPEEAENHPLRHAILQAVGTGESLAPDIIIEKIFSGDLFLLCSDGLTDMIDDASITDVLSSTAALVQKGEKLIELAKIAGGCDNITVVLCEMD